MLLFARHFGRPAKRPAAVAAVSAAALLLTGCGPKFFSAKGTVSSEGGPLRAWSRTPISCARGSQTGEPDKIAIFRFDLPAGFHPSHPGNQNAPEELDLATSGNSTIGSLKVFAPVQHPGAGSEISQSTNGFVLDASSCKTITLTHQDQLRTMGDITPMKGHLALDCNVLGSHVTADMSFQQCSF